MGIDPRHPGIRAALANRLVPAEPMTLPAVVEIPGLRVISEANARCHWSARHRRFKHQAGCVRVAVLDKLPPTAPRLVVTLTRVAPRNRGTLDGDNLAGSFKAVRDELARWLGVDDGSDRVRWEYRQAVGMAGVRLDLRAG